MVGEWPLGSGFARSLHGVQNDWSLALDQSGALNFGVGSPDQTIPGYPLIATNFYHVAVLTDYSTRQQMSVMIDNNPAVTAFGGVGTSPRNEADCRIGQPDRHYE